VHSFLRAQQVVRYDQSALLAISAQIDRLAVEEGLPAHGAAVVIREQKHRHAE
jgi:histidinol dehydrogenase